MARSVAFQGERGAFSEEAIVQQFGASVRPIPLYNLSKVFESVELEQADSAVVPIENSLEGSVNETYDLLLASKLKITGEIKLRIRPCLISKPHSGLDDIRTVYSHPQALAQCRKTLDKLGLEPRPFYDTAGSVKFVVDSADGSMAAVASSRAATIYHCRILLRDIADSKANFTRFLVLRKEPFRRVRGLGKSSLIFSTENRPRALYDALGVFADRNINLTKIESRPTKRKPWEYYFFVDFDGTDSDKPVREAIAALSTRAGFVKFLGSYPRSP
jgi:prephenate dehydratase